MSGRWESGDSGTQSRRTPREKPIRKDQDLALSIFFIILIRHAGRVNGDRLSPVQGAIQIKRERLKEALPKEDVIEVMGKAVEKFMLGCLGKTLLAIRADAPTFRLQEPRSMRSEDRNS